MKKAEYRRTLLALLRLRGYIECICNTKLYPQKILKINGDFALVKATDSTRDHPVACIIYSIKDSLTVQLCSDIKHFDSFCKNNNE